MTTTMTTGLLGKLLESGRYDWVNSGITVSRFPITEIPELKDERLFSFSRDISTEDAKAEMDKEGYRPATMAELLVYGAKNTEDQRENLIVELGSVAWVVRGGYVGVLVGCGSKRRVNLVLIGDGWSRQFRFLAVPK